MSAEWREIMKVHGTDYDGRQRRWGDEVDRRCRRRRERAKWMDNVYGRRERTTRTETDNGADEASVSGRCDWRRAG